MVKLWDLSLRNFGLGPISPSSPSGSSSSSGGGGGGGGVASSLKASSLKGLTELISVDLGRNHFGSGLPEFDWSKMTHIASIQLDDNGLTSLPTTFPGFGTVAANGRMWDICAINLKVRRALKKSGRAGD